jgi:hypothetical protein
MAISENGHGREPGVIGKSFDWLRTNKEGLKPAVFIYGTVTAIIGIGAVLGLVDENFYAPGRAAEAQRKAIAQATATALQIDKLRDDLNATGGLDVQRLDESYVFSPRGSARLAPQGALIDKAWSIVKNDGCQSLETVVYPDLTGDPAKPPKSVQIHVLC